MIKILSKIFFLIIFLNSFNISSQSKFISSAEIDTIEDQTEIPLNYLEYIPEDQYILGKGDKIAILFNNDEMIDKSYLIDNKGTIFTERLKRIYVEGLTIDELTNLLNRKFKKFVIDPNISVEIVQNRPISIFISGEVVRPEDI